MPSLRADPLLQASDWPMLGEPVLLYEFPIHEPQVTRPDYEAEVTLSQAGRFDGLMVYFDAQLSEAVPLSLYPRQAHEKNHWRSPLWLLQSGSAGLPGEAGPA